MQKQKLQRRGRREKEGTKEIMRRINSLIGIAALGAAALGFAQSTPQSQGTGAQPQATKKGSTKRAAHATTRKSPQTTNTLAVPRPKSFDEAAMDKTADPCEDFYQYACGGWRKNNPIPADQSRWGRFNELAEYNRQVLRSILEKAAVRGAKRTALIQKIGDFYASCMDESRVNAKGAEPLRPALDRIAAITTKDQFVETLAALQAMGATGRAGTAGGAPASVLFGFGAVPDLHDATREIAQVSQGGLGLPDRDYYLSTDAKMQEAREKYVAHVAKMFALLGDEPNAAEQEAQAVLRVETGLAKAEFDRVKMRDPRNRDHKMTLAELEKLAPNFHFARYFATAGAPPFTEVNVVPPDFFQQTNETLAATPLDDLKNYLRWHVLRSAAPELSESFVAENFEFTNRYLNGQKEQQARWKRCVSLTDQMLGEALGQPYVHMTFGLDGKRRTLKMVQQLEAALAADIQNLPWMTPETRKQAEIKLKAITNKIGYPDHWRDYSSVKIMRGDLLGDVYRARAFERRRQLNKIGKPLDKSEWTMTPPTVNAYYQSAENDINFPAGILQPPFYDQNADDAVNFGGIGVVIGHELTHGFDDQGSKFDAEGNFKNWWTAQDREEFEKRTTCVADEYSSFVAVDELHVNGRLTLGENTADNGGSRIALMALHEAMAQDAKRSASASTKNGFTPEQRFFLSFAQVWCENRTPESVRVLTKTDPHSPGEYRVKGTLQNNEDFWRAFSCKPGQKMVSAKPCRVW
jgi:putative endopeptidase